MDKLIRFKLATAIFLLLPIHANAQQEGEWYFVALHTHSNYSSDAVLPVKALLSEASKEGGDFIVISDHRTTQSFTDPDFRPLNGVIPVRGEEWGITGIGHAGIIGLAEGNDSPISDRSDPDRYIQLIQQATDRGALVFINHPFHSRTRWPAGWVPGLAGVEVWNAPWFFPPLNNQRATDWWQALLEEQATRITGVAVSDFHYPFIQHIMQPCVMVYATSKSPEAMLQGLRDGHVIMVAWPQSPKVFLLADDGEGNFTYKVGHNILVTQNRTITFKITTVGSGPLDHIRIFTKTGQVDNGDLIPGPGKWEYHFNLDCQAYQKNLVRVELRGSALNWPHCMTNPIYLNY